MWKEIEEYPNYKVNRFGYVKNTNTNHMLSFNTNNNGFKRVILQKGRENKQHQVHYLVYEAFVGEVPEGNIITFKDGNKDNCNVSNLKLSTRSEEKTNTNKGKSIKYRRYDDDTKRQVKEDLKNGVPLTTLNKEYGISMSYLSKIKEEKVWTNI